MEGGFLVYKCRRCGKLIKKIHVPDGITALIDITDNFKLTSLCNCGNSNLGISDLIGFEKD